MRFLNWTFELLRFLHWTLEILRFLFWTFEILRFLFWTFEILRFLFLTFEILKFLFLTFEILKFLFWTFEILWSHKIWNFSIVQVFSPLWRFGLSRRLHCSARLSEWAKEVKYEKMLEVEASQVPLGGLSGLLTLSRDPWPRCMQPWCI